MGKAIYVGVSGVARAVKQPYVGVGGVAREVINGYSGIAGVARQFYPTITLGSLNIGDSVYINVNSVPTEFIVIQHGQPENTGLYDSTFDNGTWLMMKMVSVDMGQRQMSKQNTGLNTSFAEKPVFDYRLSDMHTYLNSTFFNLIDSRIRSSIKQVNIPSWLASDEGWEYYLGFGETGLPAKVFLLSAGELGWGYLSGDYQCNAGATVSYFSNSIPEQTYEDYMAYYYNKSTGKTTAVNWWLRSPVDINGAYSSSPNFNLFARAVGSAGEISGYVYYNEIAYVRPVIVLPSTMSI